MYFRISPDLNLVPMCAPVFKYFSCSKSTVFEPLSCSSAAVSVTSAIPSPIHCLRVKPHDVVNQFHVGEEGAPAAIPFHAQLGQGLLGVLLLLHPLHEPLEGLDRVGRGKVLL